MHQDLAEPPGAWRCGTDPVSTAARYWVASREAGRLLGRLEGGDDERVVVRVCVVPVGFTRCAGLLDTQPNEQFTSVEAVTPPKGGKVYYTSQWVLQASAAPGRTAAVSDTYRPSGPAKDCCCTVRCCGGVAYRTTSNK